MTRWPTPRNPSARTACDLTDWDDLPGGGNDRRGSHKVFSGAIDDFVGKLAQGRHLCGREELGRCGCVRARGIEVWRL